MTPEFNRLPKSVQDRLRPLLPTMQREATKAGLPLNALISIAAEESGGDPTAVGDKNLAVPAKGLYQVRDTAYWLGGADPMNPEAATAAIAPRLKKLYDSCGGDMQCLHYKMMAGQGAAYSPEAVAQRSQKFPHVGERLQRVQSIYGADQPKSLDSAIPAWPDAGAGRGKVTPPAVVPSQDDTLTALASSAVPARPKADPVDTAADDFYTALMGLNPYADAPSAVKSRKRTNILGL